MFIFVGGAPVVIPEVRVPHASPKPPKPYAHSIDYHLLAENPHKVTRSMIGLSAEDYVAPAPIIKPKRKEFEMEGMNRITYSSNWGGGAFMNCAGEDSQITVIGKRGEQLHATLAKGKVIYGADHDHGHSYNWTFQDYNVMLAEDLFDRKSSLLEILKADIPVYGGHLSPAEVMRYRDHRGGLPESLETVMVMPRTVEALVGHLNAQENIFLDRGVTANDLEFHPAGYDTRIAWNTVWVKVKGFGVVGCIDGEIK